MRGRPVVALSLMAALAMAGACGPPPQRRTVAMEPIGTVAPPAADPEVPAAAPGGASPPAGPAEPIAEGPCAGADFDSLEVSLRACEVPTPRRGDLPSGLRDKLELRVATTTGTVAPGGRVELLLLLRNTSSEPLPLFFAGAPAPRFDVEAADAKGKRVDRPAGRAPAYPRGGGPRSRETKAFRVTLAPGGVARVRLAWDAVKTRWAPELVKTWDGRGYPVAPAGPLPPGTVTLRVVLPLLGGSVDAPKASVVVTP